MLQLRETMYHSIGIKPSTIQKLDAPSMYQTMLKLTTTRAKRNLEK